MGSDRRVTAAAWGLGLASLLVWFPILPWSQPQQQLRRAVESDLRDGHIDRALAIISRHQRGDFPPHWDPPPRIGYGEQHPPIVEVFEACLANDTKPWVAGLCLRKFEQTGYADGAHAYGNRMDSDRFDRFLELLERLPDDSSVVADFEEALAAQLGDQSSRTELQRARVRALLPDNR